MDNSLPPWFRLDRDDPKPAHRERLAISGKLGTTMIGA
jgi:hypothetical protein